MNLRLSENIFFYKFSIVFANMVKKGYVKDLYGNGNVGFRVPATSYKFVRLLEYEGIIKTYKEGRVIRYDMTKKGIKIHKHINFIIRRMSK